MRSRRIIGLACAVGMLAAVASAGSAAGSTTVMHFVTVGPGAQAFWEGGQDEAGNTTTTNFLVFRQVSAPGSQGHFQGVVVIRQGWNEDGFLYMAIYDSSGVMPAPTITLRQPLVSAHVSGTAPLVSCDGACPATLPDTVSFDETWTGTGAITRDIGNAWLDHVPGVMLDREHHAVSFRTATLSAADPFAGELGDLGTLSTSDPGVRFFDVHTSSQLVCHPSATAEVCLES